MRAVDDPKLAAQIVALVDSLKAKRAELDAAIGALEALGL